MSFLDVAIYATLKTSHNIKQLPKILWLLTKGMTWGWLTPWLSKQNFQNTTRKLGMSRSLTAGAEDWGSIYTALIALGHPTMLALAGSRSELKVWICLLGWSFELLFSDCADPKIMWKTSKTVVPHQQSSKAFLVQSLKCWLSQTWGCLQKPMKSYLILPASSDLQSYEVLSAFQVSDARALHNTTGFQVQGAWPAHKAKRVSQPPWGQNNLTSRWSSEDDE